MKALDFFFAARPLLHMPIWSVYLVCLHYQDRASGNRFSVTDLIVLACLSLLFAGAFYINQVFDYDSDRINKKGGFLQRGFISEKAMMAASLIVSLLPLAVVPFISLLALAVFLQVLVLAYFYSTPPLRLKDRPVSGLLANSYSHGFLVAVAVMWQTPIHRVCELNWSNPLYFTLTVGATYILTTIPDRLGDKATGKRTLAVVLGPTGALLAALLLLAASVFVAYQSGFAALVYLSGFALFTILAALLIRTSAVVLLAAKMPLLALTIFAGYHYPGYFLFIVALLIGTRIYYRQRFGVVYPRLA